MTDGEAQIWAPTSHKDYEVIVELNKFVDTLRKKAIVSPTSGEPAANRRVLSVWNTP